jgi:hypothetical protein
MMDDRALPPTPDEVLRRMLNSPPKPHPKQRAKKKQAKKRRK